MEKRTREKEDDKINDHCLPFLIQNSIFKGVFGYLTLSEVYVSTRNGSTDVQVHALHVHILKVL